MSSIPPDRAATLEAWGWHYPDAAIAQSLSAELQREVGPGHLLYGPAVETVAFRQEQDDVSEPSCNEPGDVAEGLAKGQWRRAAQVSCSAGVRVPNGSANCNCSIWLSGGRIAL
jgi:hypothetical protein